MRTDSIFKTLSRSSDIPNYPIRVLQFGEGNFLRAFADWMIHQMNKKAGFNSGVAVVQPIEKGLSDQLNRQEGLYTVLLRGLKDGSPLSESYLVDCIQRAINPYHNFKEYLELAQVPSLRFIISNTTEAGIQLHDDSVDDAPPIGFPSKLTLFLKRRYDYFNGDPSTGLYILPCELIENNGAVLKEHVLSTARRWGFDKGFVHWVLQSCEFCTTLVDRIVPGFPRNDVDEIIQELGYEDKLLVESEQFGLWVIEGSNSLQEELPVEQAELNIIFTDDISPYRIRKVRILNGAHTCMVPIGLLSGIETVREVMEHPILGPFIQDTIEQEISSTIALPRDELQEFSNQVMERFLNPFIRHELQSISLNSISKFRVRVLPSITDYYGKTNAPPKRMLFALSCLIFFYLADGRALNDEPSVVAYFERIRTLTCGLGQKISQLLSNKDLWGENLTQLAGLEETVFRYVNQLGGAAKPIELLESI